MEIVRSFFMKKEVSMKSKLYMACAMAALAAVSCLATAETPNSEKLSRAELKQMVREAHTTEQYLTLASYYRWRQQQFNQQAHDELVFWAQRSANVSLLAAKYPSPAASSKNRYDYFNYEAEKMSQQAAHYEDLAASTK
jgi:hypothetical protein